MSTTSSSAVVRQVLNVCKKYDNTSKLAYVGVDERAQTVLRIRSGVHTSVVQLQSTLASLLPLGRVATSENPLDGSMEAMITLPSEQDQYVLARRMVAQRRSALPLHLGARAMLCGHLVLWHGIPQ